MSSWRHFAGAELRYLIITMVMFVVGMSVMFAPKHVTVVQSAPADYTTTAQ